MDPYSSPYIIPNNSPNNHSSFPTKNQTEKIGSCDASLAVSADRTSPVETNSSTSQTTAVQGHIGPLIIRIGFLLQGSYNKGSIRVTI